MTAHMASGKLVDTFDLSISGYTGRDENDDNENVLGSDAQIRIGAFELLSELALGDQVVDTPAGSSEPMERSDTHGFYIQAAYRVAPMWHLFYRFDDLQLLSGDGEFDSDQHTLGVNFRPRPNISLKLELFHAIFDGRDESFNGLASSIVYNF